MSATIKFYWNLLMRRSPAMIALVVLFVAVAIAYAAKQPNRYEAEATLLVESAQIPDDLASSTVNTAVAEQLQIIEGRLMSRSTLIEIANEYGVFDGATNLAPDQMADIMRASTTIRQTVRRDQATFMTIGFTAGSAELTAAVVNEYVTRILQDNIRIRTERAGNTLEFFEQEVDRLSAELSRQSTRISEFKAANSNSLPEALNFRLSRVAALEERLAGLQRELQALEDQRQRVTSVYQETGRLQRPEAELSPEERQLRTLENELSSALAVYSETNPRVVILRTRIDQLRKVVAGQDGTGETASASTSIYEITLAEIDARARTLTEQVSSVEAELVSVRKLIDQTPQTAIALESLERDYRNVQSQYDAATARLARARTGEQIELTAQGQRITVVENAVAPQWPSSPNRKLIVAAGGLAGVAAALGLFALLEVLNSTIRRPGELVARLGVTPLATIPYIETRRQRLWRRTAQAMALLLFFVVVPAALFVVDRYVMPLGEVVQAARDLI